MAVNNTGLAAVEPEEGMAQGLAPTPSERVGGDANYLGDLPHPGRGRDTLPWQRQTNKEEF